MVRLVLHQCVWKVHTAKECLPEPHYCKLAGCDADRACVPKTTLSLLPVFAHHVLNVESHIVKSEKLKSQQIHISVKKN